MKGMRAEEAGRFYEEDEDPDEVFALFDAAEKGRTAPPRPMTDSRRSVAWANRLRHELASALRWAANFIDSTHARAR
jgi:hypothetical protein